MSNLHPDRIITRKVMVLFMVAILGPMHLRSDEEKVGKVVLEIKGYLLPARQVSVTVQVPGRVKELLVEEGKQVKAGDMLARLDPAEQEAACNLARAELKLALAGLEKAGKESNGMADLSVVQAKVEVAKARVQVAEVHLKNTFIHAPFDGTILARYADIGTWIDPNASQGPANLCVLADLRTIEVELWIPEKDLSKVAKGQACLIRLSAFPTVTYQGKVARLLPVADRAKGAVGMRVRLEIPEGDEKLRPDMSAIVQILAEK